MKTITEFLNPSSKTKLRIPENTINYINKEDLEKYLTVTDKFISDEAKELINWLIVNNDSYITDLSNDLDENALAGFYKAGVPAKENLKALYKLIGKIVKSGRTMEIPVFQTKEQFDSIINKKIPADAVILDLESEEGRAAIVKKYEPLIHLISRQWQGKINLTYKELNSVCYEGLVYAMNTYSKKNKKSKATDEAISKYTFGQYAAQCMKNHILGYGVYDSHLVHIPNSQQKKERKEKGHNTKNFSISGDQLVGHDNEGNGKTIFDYIGDTTNAEGDVNAEDRQKLWTEIWNILDKKFDKKTLDIWCSYWGLRGYKKLQNKQIASKYNVASSNITYYCHKVNMFCKNDETVNKLFKELYSIVKESISERDNGEVESKRLVY